MKSNHTTPTLFEYWIIGQQRRWRKLLFCNQSFYFIFMNHLNLQELYSCGYLASTRINEKGKNSFYLLWGLIACVCVCVCAHTRGYTWVGGCVYEHGWMLSTSGCDGFGIKATQHTASKRNNSTRTLSRFHFSIFHYSPSHPSLSVSLSLSISLHIICVSVPLSHPSAFSVISSPCFHRT